MTALSHRGIGRFEGPRPVIRSFRPMNRKEGGKGEAGKFGSFRGYNLPTRPRGEESNEESSYVLHPSLPPSSSSSSSSFSSTLFRSTSISLRDSVHSSVDLSRKEARLRKRNDAETAQMTREFSPDSESSPPSPVLELVFNRRPPS